MNYLAHAYLSFNEPEIIVGNMISDFVKGRQKFHYPPTVQLGIQLHRDIDAYTDAHPATAKAKEIFKPDYRLYSGALMDVLYDYFLANDVSIFTPQSLQAFSVSVYHCLDANREMLPPAFLQLLPHMKQNNWLYNYRTKEGMQRSLAGLVRRAAYLTDSDTAYHLFVRHEAFLADCYQEFFPGVKLMAKARMQQLGL